MAGCSAEALSTGLSGNDLALVPREMRLERERERDRDRDRDRQTDRQTERERERENTNSKTLILKDSSVMSIWTYLTASPCYTTNTNKHNTTNKYYKHY